MNSETKNEAAESAWLDYECKDGCLYKTTFIGGFQAGYDHAAAEMRWILVKTRYPDRSGVYDVTLWDGTISKSAYYCGAFDKSVRAWMPMPTEPYTNPADPDAGKVGDEELHCVCGHSRGQHSQRGGSPCHGRSGPNNTECECFAFVEEKL